MLQSPTAGRLEAPADRRSARSLVLVAGSGRSGTSLFSGILQRLGYTVPPPEVPADDTNPRGFAESQWVVDFHTRLLRAARVQVADGRPAASALTAPAALDGEHAAELRRWLAQQLRAAEHIVVKDPRVSWFLPLWRRCAEEVGVEPRFVTMLRHPAAVVDSKQRWYGARQGEAARTAGWVNQTLFTERATRESPRVFIRYDDLLADWTRPVGRAGELLDLEPVRRASPPEIRRVHEFVDGGLSRSHGDWEHLAVPPPLRELAEDVWTLVSRLAEEPEGDAGAACERLDELRGAYAQLYSSAEAIVQSSVAAARIDAVPRQPVPTVARWVVRRVPARYRRRVPAAWRARALRALRGPR